MRSKKKFKSVFDVLGIKVIDKIHFKPETQDLELALLEVIYLADEDMHFFNLLIAWCEIHSDSIIYEKLEKHYSLYSKYRGKTIVYDIFMIFCAEFGKRRIKSRCSRQKSKILFPNSTSTKAMLKKSPPIDVLKKYNIYLPENALRIRIDDIFSVKDLANRNQQYKNRYLFGACWRSDIIFCIEGGATSPSEIARVIGCSYEPANRIWNDYYAVN